MVHLKETHLVLFLTRGISLKTWDDTGMLEREVALYRKLRPYLNGITFVTYGDAHDSKFVDQLDGIRVVCNRWRLPQELYVRLLFRLHPLQWKGSTIVKSNQVLGADIALEVARRLGKKFVARCGYLYSDFMEYRHGSDSQEARTAQDLERKVFNGADRVVVTTPTMRDVVVQRYHFPAERVRVIPNYVDTDTFLPASDSPRSSRRICFVGRLDEQKNLFGMLEAVKGLDVEVVIVGRGPLEKQLREEAKLHGQSVRFLGNIPNRNLPEILNSAALFVLPSHYEGHPKALLEAMACGLPVIGTDVPGIREVIRDRETGYLCGLSVEEIRAAIQEVLSDAELRAWMGRNAKEFIVKHFALERIMKMEMALLEGLLED